MALQLCSIISTNCFHIGFNNCSRIAPAMFRFRVIQNLPYSCFSHIPNCSVMRLGREVLIRTSNLLHAACYNRYYVTFCLNKHRRNSFISLVRQNYSFSSVLVGGNGYTTNYPASERLFKRLFSSVQHQFQPSAKANRSGKDANGDENGKSAAQKPLPKKKKKKKKNKPLPVIHEITRQLDSEVIGHTVTKSAGADEINKKVLKDCRKKKGNELQPSSKAYMVSKNAVDRDTKSEPQRLHAKKKNKSLSDADEITELQGTDIISHTITGSSKAIANKKKSPKVGQKKKEKKIRMPSIVNMIGKDAINGNRNQMLHAKKKKNNPLPAVDEITELLDTKAVSHTVTSPEEAISCEKKVSKDDDIKKVIIGSRVEIKGAKALTIENGKHNSMKHEGISESHSFLASPKSNDLKQESLKKKAGITGGFQVLQNKSTVTLTGVKNRNKKLRPLYPPSGKSVVVVESMTKARVIQNYLGPSYEVLASYGHVRDLARRSGSVRPDDDFSLVWEVPSSAWTHLKSIKMSLNSAENLILASDPDREGEAIAWHIIEMLQQQDALNENIRVARVVFHEITETSIKSALETPREINSNLVNAYLARRALDYLIGFNISPLLWRKLPGCSSAGRVQSAALALICDRETEIDQSKSREYWTVRAEFFGSFPDTLDRSTISSNLTHFNSKRLGRFSIISKQNAEAIQKKVISLKFDVIDVRRNKSQRKPPMPYITSTLQQDSANKLNFTSVHTMRLAQQLYEGVNLSGKEATGLITYMRTDGMHISNEAAKDINSFVGERYGGEFSSKDIRKYFKKVKNAQEAHEAIRPTNIRRLPSSLAGILDEDSLKLYGLIWSRTIACQMEPALIDTISVDIGNVGGDVVFRTVGSRIDFQGYKAAYKDRDAVIDSISHDEEDDSNVSVFWALHGLKVEDSISLVKVDISQHFTKPPSRYSEGALVKKLEELGIGRPSTYASIMKVLQDRSYVTMKNRVLHPEFRGRMVSEFLSHHFSEVANYSFTAAMEAELDNISVGVTEWKCLLRDYWSRFIERCNLASQVGINQVEKMMEEKFGHVVFSLLPNDNRLCPSCGEGTMKFKVSRYGTGYFIGCDQYPQCRYIAGTIGNSEEECVAPDNKIESFVPKLLGCHPKSNEKIYLKKGPYGFYVQLGDGRIGCSAKKCSVIEGTDTDSFALEDALDLLKYPITLGKHPDDGALVTLRQSKQGFSIKHKGSVCVVPKSMKPKTITLEMCVKLLKSKKTKKLGRPKGKLNNYGDEVKEEKALVV